MGLPIWRESHSAVNREATAKAVKQAGPTPQEDARSPIRRSRRSTTRRFHEDVSRGVDSSAIRAYISAYTRDTPPAADSSRTADHGLLRLEAHPIEVEFGDLLERLDAQNRHRLAQQYARAREEQAADSLSRSSARPASSRPRLERSRSSANTASTSSNIDMTMSLLELSRLSTEEQIRIMREALAFTSQPAGERSAPVLVREDTFNAPRAAGESFMTDATVADMDVEATPRASVISDVRSFLNEIRPGSENMEREASTGAADLARSTLSFYADAEPRRRVQRVDGLGDRDRSLSPDDAWETLLTNITPDSRLPSAESSFTSAAASFSATSSALSLGAQSDSTNPTSVSNHSLYPCEFGSSSDASDTEADEGPNSRSATSGRLFGSSRLPPAPLSERRAQFMRDFSSVVDPSESDFSLIPPSSNMAGWPVLNRGTRLLERERRRDLREVRRQTEAMRNREQRVRLRAMPMPPPPPQNPTTE